MTRKVIIGSRGSKLALIQAESVAAQIRLAKPDLHVEIRRIITEGDRNLRINIEETVDVGIFVKALEEALISGDIDIAVHSLKDLPVIQPEGLCLVAVTRREDPRDVLVASASLIELRSGSKIGTSSIRRAVQVRNLRKDIEIVGIRGNVDSRLRKVASGAVDGIIVAAAAMIRLGCEGEITEYLPLETFVPAAGQGALAIEARHDDKFAGELGRLINHDLTLKVTSAERSFLDAFGGGCSVPISAVATTENGRLVIIGMVSDRLGKKIYKDTLEDDLHDAKASGVKLAHKMLESGARKIIAELRCK